MENNINVNPDWVISAEELTSWAQLRDENRPALTGSPKWRNWGVGVLGLSEHHLDTGQPYLNIPGYGMAGFLGFYWTTASGIVRWSCEHALRQIRTMTQLTIFLMQTDLTEIQPH